MEERMDIDNPNPPPTSRDPRLSRNKPTLARAASLDTGVSGSPNTLKFSPQLMHSDRQDGITGDQLFHGLSELIKAAVDTATRNTEKEKLLKRKETTEGLLRKAKAAPTFPSTTAFFQQARNDEDSDLTRMDDTIARHQAQYHQLESTLMTKWVHSLQNNPASDERISKLDGEIQVLKKGLGHSMGGANAKLLETEVKMLRDRLVLLEKASGNHSISINNQIKQGKETNERVDRLSLDLAQLPSQGAMLSRFTSEVEELKKITTSLDARISSLDKAHREYSSSLTLINKSMDEQHKHFDVSNEAVNSFKQQFGEIHERLASLKKVEAAPPQPVTQNAGSHPQFALSNLEKRLKDVEGSLATTPRPNPTLLDSKIQALSDKLHQLQSLQAMKDELHFAELEELKKALVNKEELQFVKDNCTRLIEDMGKINHWCPATTQQIKTHDVSIQNMQKILQSLQVGLHSLEMRYNHLSTEPIVQKTIAALQELYPPTAQLNKLTEQVTALRNEAKEVIPPLKRTVEQLVQTRNSQENSIKRLQEETSQRWAEAAHLKDTSGKLAHQVSGIQDQLAKVLHLSDKVHQLHTNFDSLTEKYREHMSEMQEQVKSNKETNAQNNNRLEESYRKLDDQVQQLSNELSQINNTMVEVRNTTTTAVESVAEIRSTGEKNTHMANSQQDDLRALIDRFSRFEESVLADHRGLIAQIETLEQTVGPRCPSAPVQDESETAPGSRIVSPKREESWVESGTTSPVNYAGIAESNPALALREKKKKKKRPRPSGLSDDDQSPAPRHDSPRTFQSPARTVETQSASPSEAKKRSKKKKKRRLHMEEPIVIE